MVGEERGEGGSERRGWGGRRGRGDSGGRGVRRAHWRGIWDKNTHAHEDGKMHTDTNIHKDAQHQWNTVFFFIERFARPQVIILSSIVKFKRKINIS